MPLELVKRLPNVGIAEPNCVNPAFLIEPGVNVITEKFIERLEIDQFRRVFLPNTCERVEHFLLGVRGQPFVVPDAVEPVLQFGVDLRVAAGEVDLNVGTAAGAKSALCKVGTPNDAADRGRSQV